MNDILKRTKFIHILALLIVVICSAAFFIVLLHPDFLVGDTRTQVITAIIGLIMLAVGYFFNSTIGSFRKTELMSQSQSPEQK